MRQEVWTFASVAIALLASLYVLDITGTMFLVPELTGKDFECKRFTN